MASGNIGRKCRRKKLAGKKALSLVARLRQVFLIKYKEPAEANSLHKKADSTTTQGSEEDRGNQERAKWWCAKAKLA
jgi:hypothetical protein